MMDTLRKFILGTCVALFAVAAQANASTVVERMEQRCREYAESVYEFEPDPVLLPGAEPKRTDTCRISTQMTIVGGEKAGPQEFPHMALIGYRDGKKTKSNEPIVKWRCGGSLISDQWVLSAAHCVATLDTHELARYARLGDLDVLSKEDDDNYDAGTEVFIIIKWHRHPDYKRPRTYNDIALFKLDKAVEFSRFIRPICLHGLLSSKNNTVLASGWGATSFEKGISSSHLLKVGLDVVDNSNCDRQWRESVGVADANRYKLMLSNGVREQTQVCAWAEGKDSCQGDSGGPIQQLLSDIYCMYTIIGVTSIGNKCGGQIPGIYTRVHPYLPWIESKVWPQS